MSDRLTAATDGLIVALNRATTAFGLYSPNHPQAEAALRETATAVEALFAELQAPSFTLLLIEHELVVDGTPWRRAALHRAALVRTLERAGMERLSVEIGVESTELRALLVGLTGRGPLESSERIAVSRIEVDESAFGEEDGGSGVLEARLDDVREALRRFVAGGPGPAVPEAAALPSSAPGLPRLDRALWQLLEVLALGNRAFVLHASVATAEDRLLRHSLDTCLVAAILARAVGLHDRVLHEVALSALLHDIGFVDLPEGLRSGRRPASERERRLLRSHTSLGAARLAGVHDMPAMPILVALDHHRPFRSGAETDPPPLLATRIVAVADRWDALLDIATHSAEHARRPRVFAAEAMRRRAGSDLDPELVSVLLERFPETEEPAAATGAPGLPDLPPLPGAP